MNLRHKQLERNVECSEVLWPWTRIFLVEVMHAHSASYRAASMPCNVTVLRPILSASSYCNLYPQRLSGRTILAVFKEGERTIASSKRCCGCGVICRIDWLRDTHSFRHFLIFIVKHERTILAKHDLQNTLQRSLGPKIFHFTVEDRQFEQNVLSTSVFSIKQRHVERSTIGHNLYNYSEMSGVIDKDI